MPADTTKSIQNVMEARELIKQSIQKLVEADIEAKQAMHFSKNANSKNIADAIKSLLTMQEQLSNISTHVRFQEIIQQLAEG
jgi:hypothetical protein